MKVLFRGIAMLCVLQLSLFAEPAHSQNQDGGAFSNHKLLYGIHLGFTESKVDLYSTQGGTLHRSKDEKHPFYTPGFRIAVIGEIQMGRYFSLRVMPGTSFFKTYNIESVRGELPVDVKFHPFRKGNLQPYLSSGLGYSYDFATRREDIPSVIKPLNAHDLRYTCGLGMDWDTHNIKVGVEAKAGFGLLPPGTGGKAPSYFHTGPTFSVGLNFEA